MAWLRDYLSDREQYTVINGAHSENTNVAHGIPQGSVLGPILFALYTSDLPKAVNSVTTFLYADDTTMYCVGESVDQVTATLNKALEELALWCKKCEGMILKRNHFIGPLGSLKINQHLIKWSSSSNPREHKHFILSHDFFLFSKQCIHWFPKVLITKELGPRHCSRQVQIPKSVEAAMSVRSDWNIRDLLWRWSNLASPVIGGYRLRAVSLFLQI